jgi:hypothetical protein
VTCRVLAGLDRTRYPSRGQIARVLPADTEFQTVRTGAKLDFDVSDVLTMVANAVTSAHALQEARSAPCETYSRHPRQTGKHLTDP